jgi:hypothetical protein
MRKLDIILKYNEYISNIDYYLNDKHIEIYNDIESSYIAEGLIKTFDKDKSLQILLKNFKELSGNIEPDDEIYLEGHFKELVNYLPLINNLGYFISLLTLNGKDWVKEYSNETKPLALLLEAKYDIRIINKPTILYHVSLKKNEDRILKYGLYPKSFSKISNHSDRIYLTDSLQVAKLFGMNLGKEFIICEISGVDIDLYEDINLKTYGFYTLDNISKEKIKII